MVSGSYPGHLKKLDKTELTLVRVQAQFMVLIADYTSYTDPVSRKGAAKNTLNTLSKAFSAQTQNPKMEVLDTFGNVFHTVCHPGA